MMSRFLDRTINDVKQQQEVRKTHQMLVTGEWGGGVDYKCDVTSNIGLDKSRPTL